MSHGREYGDFEVSGQAALHAGDCITYVTNTGTVLFVDSQHIDLKTLMPQLKHQTQHLSTNHPKPSRTFSRVNNHPPSHQTHNHSHISSSSSCPCQSQTQVQLHEVYAYKPDPNPQLIEDDSKSASVAKARLLSHLNSTNDTSSTTSTSQDKVFDLVSKSTQHLHLQSPADFRPSSLLRQSIGLAGYVAVSLVTIGVEAAQDRYRNTTTQTSNEVK